MPVNSVESKQAAYKPRIFKGTVYIVKNRCKGCRFCIEYCPKHILEPSEEFNDKGYHYPVVIDEHGCVNCKVCEDICPEFAVFSVTAAEGNASKDANAKGPGGAR
jgi:2-oxoglutarate ferredoxin oxidoreductase subunit delta